MIHIRRGSLQAACAIAQRSRILSTTTLAGALLVAAPAKAAERQVEPAAVVNPGSVEAPADHAAASDRPSTDTPAHSAPAPQGAANGDIVVTAQKRSERLQDVPISITSVSGAAMEQSGVRQIFDLPRLVPTLRVGDGPGTVAAKIVIRGVGSFGNSSLEPSVAVFQDDVYVPRPASIVTNIFDVAAIDVLSGPQGTLFGRNASAGAITIRSAPPESQFSGSLEAQASSLDRQRFEGYVNTPLSDTVALRVAGLADLRGGDWIN